MGDDFKGYVYLSGKIDDLTYEEACRDRAIATELLTARGWRVLDPMRGKGPGMKNDTVISDKVRHVSDNALVGRDLQDLRDSAAILVLTADEKSYGTIMEWGISAEHYRKPVVAVDRKQVARNHPWCRKHSVYFADSIEEGVEWIDTFYVREFRG